MMNQCSPRKICIPLSVLMNARVRSRTVSSPMIVHSATAAVIVMSHFPFSCDRMHLPHGRGEKSLLGRFARSEFAGDSSLVQHDDAVAHAKKLRQLAGDHHDRDAARGEIVDEVIDLKLG